jgi:hypothetical protein
MHKVVEEKDVLLKQIYAANMRFEDDLAKSAVHLQEIQAEAAKSKKEVAAAIKDVRDSKAELHELKVE